MANLRKITLDEFHAELKAQGVPSREHCAVKCVSCGTVQSLADFREAGVETELADRQIGFSCIGRHTDAKGCDWTLGGFLTIHTLIVVMPDDKESPAFEPATPQEAMELFESRTPGVEA